MPGSCAASGFRHGPSASDRTRSRPVARIVSVSSTPPAYPTADTAATSTWTVGYDPVVFTLKVLPELGELASQQFQFSQIRSTSHIKDTTSAPLGDESPSLLYVRRRDRGDDEKGRGTWWRVIHTAIGNLHVVLPVAFLVAMAAWVWLVAWLWPQVVAELRAPLSDVLDVSPAAAAIMFNRWVSIATLVIALVAFAFAVSVGRWKAMRGPIDIIADVTGFFPIQWHPLAGLSYRSRVMSELEGVMALTSGPVIYSGHSQGSVIGLWFLRHRAQHPDRVHLVTSGSPIRSLYATFFPRFVNQDVIEETLLRVASWTNVFWRATDPIATRIDASVGGKSITNIKSLDPPARDAGFPEEDRERDMEEVRWHLEYWDDYNLVGVVNAIAASSVAAPVAEGQVGEQS